MFGLQNALLVFLGNGARAVFENWRVHFSRIEICDAHPVGADFIGDTGTKRRHRELAGTIGDATQRRSAFSSNR